MLSRRHFIEASAVLAGASVALCRPALAMTGNPPAPVAAGTPGAAQRHYLQWRRQFYGEHDPKIFLGYPANMNGVSEGFLAWREALREVDLGELLTNNVGDPFRKPAPYTTHPLEMDLVQRFAGRFGFPADDSWGFVSHSGTDSNMHGAYIGRTLLQQRTGVRPKIYYTAEAHYSIQIIRDLLGLEEVLIATGPDAGMDLGDLAAKLAQHPDSPVLLVATIGTTFKGGIDDIDGIRARLKDRPSYLHLDAALFGGYLHASPFAGELHQYRDGHKRYDSIAVSCHKFFGYPAAAGLFICGRQDFEEYRGYFEQVHDPAYISHVPGTITCSRDAVKPAEFHYFCTPESLAVQTADAAQVLADAQYLQEQMQRHFPELQSQRANSRSNTVYFNNTVSQRVRDKWVLATIAGSDQRGPSLAHAVVMPHASRGILDQFLEDLARDRRSPAPA
jgi:histidine decarboxylase